MPQKFLTWSRRTSNRGEVGFGVGADVGEAGGIGHASGLAGVGVGPALALLEFDGVIVEQLIDGDGWEEYRACLVVRGRCPVRLGRRRRALIFTDHGSRVTG